MENSAPRRQFASDNYAGICPEAWQAMEAANRGYATSYGDDPWTDKACQCLRELFETDCEVFFVFNGTAANSLALASLCHSYHSVICHEMSHVETDECGAAEFFSNGTKVLLVPGDNGKVDLAAVEAYMTRVLGRASEVGGQVMVFGSGGARRAPEPPAAAGGKQRAVSARHPLSADLAGAMQRAAAERGIVFDECQLAVAGRLQRLFDQLVAFKRARRTKLRLLLRFQRR